MLNKNKVYYSLRQREKTKSIQLLEHVDSVSGLFVKPIAIVFPWRAEMIKMFVERLSQQTLRKFDQKCFAKGGRNEVEHRRCNACPGGDEISDEYKRKAENRGST